MVRVLWSVSVYPHLCGYKFVIARNALSLFLAEALMAAKSCDDPVDLGPFLQNYVMKNPFSESSLLVTSSPSIPSSSSSSSPEKTNWLESVREARANYISNCDTDRPPRTVAEMLRRARGGDHAVAEKSKRGGHVRSAPSSANSSPYRPIRPRIDDKETVNVPTSTPHQTPAVQGSVVQGPGVLQAPIVVQMVGVSTAKTSKKSKRKASPAQASVVTPKVGIPPTKKSIVMLANPDEMMDKYGNSTDCDRRQIESW